MTSWASTYSVSSTYGSYTGHSASSGSGLRDGTYNSSSTVWGTAGASGWISVDLGEVKQFASTDIAPISSSFDAWGASYLNGAVLQVSTDGSSWTDVVTLSGHADNVLKRYEIGSTTGRYLRINSASSYLGVGDWKIDYIDVGTPAFYGSSFGLHCESANPSYQTGFAPRDAGSRFPDLWRGCIGAFNPGLGPTGDVLRDQSRFANHATLSGHSWYLAGGEYSLSMPSGSGVVPSADIFDVSRVTISAWLTTQTYTVDSNDIVIIRSGTSSPYLGFTLRGATTQSISGAIALGGTAYGVQASLSSYVSLDKWFHVAVTYDASSLIIYINGRERSTASLGGTMRTTPGELVGIGDDPHNPGRYWPGLIGEIRLYDRALSASEISTLARRRGIAYEQRRTATPMITSASATFHASWARNSNILIGL